MKRLTKKFGDKVLLPSLPMGINSKEDLDKFHEVRRDIESKIIRLAEYEDTGLTPEEIKLKSEDSITITGEVMYNFIRDYCIHHDSYWNYCNQLIHKCGKNKLQNFSEEPECFPCMSCKEYLYPYVKKDIEGGK